MTTSPDLITRLAALCDLAEEITGSESLPAAVAQVTDAEVVQLAQLATALGQSAERVRVAAAGVIGARSSRTAGHAGLAQSLGHRSAAALLQHVTGGTRGEAARQLRVGESLFDSGSGPAAGVASLEAPGASPSSGPWHAPLRSALMGGRLSTAQHDAIRRGLGEPPVSQFDDGSGPATDDGLPPVAAAQQTAANAAAIEAWSLAAERLVAEAAELPVEELAKQARAIRDLLDPEGAEARYLARYEARSFRLWTDADGQTRGSFVFDDESAAWLRSIIDTALRPRRGGPRFVNPAERAAADALVNDPRSNEQLAHDLLVDVWRAGTLADAATVLGARQAGVRMVHTVNREDARGRQQVITRLEDDGVVLPAAAAAQQRCNSGVVPVLADTAGNPLDVGREQRLYTPKQRIALAVRDGGCRWTGCDRPASYCEAHHIDEWSAQSGRTDIDRGILLCRFHHMQLHHGRWRITRVGLGPFMLHPPPGAGDAEPGVPPPIELRPPLPLRYGWEHAKSPPKRFLAAA